MQKQIGFRKINTDAPHKDNSEHKEFLQSYRFLCIILIDSQDATNQNGDLNQTQPIKEISIALGPTSCPKFVFTSVVLRQNHLAIVYFTTAVLEV